jgi:zona occludens toxin (predicted ATPase)
MIAIISGLPGSGKTLSALKRFIIPAIKEGRQIYTNIEGINLLGLSLYTDTAFEKNEKNLIAYEDKAVKSHGKELATEEPKEPFKFSTKRMCEGIAVNSLVVVDEAQTFWNNRDYASEENKALLPFLQKHRHYGIDIIFLTQNIDQLDIGIRRLTQVHYRLRRLTNSGLDKVVKVDVYPDAMGSEQFKPMATNVWTIDKGIFKFYKSYLPSASEAKKPISNIILKNPRILFALFVIAFCSAFAWHTFTTKGKNIFAPKMLVEAEAKQKELDKAKEIDFLNSVLGEYEEYYCGEKFYILRSNGKVDTLLPKNIPPAYCPHVNFNFKRIPK